MEKMMMDTVEAVQINKVSQQPVRHHFLSTR